MDGKNMGGGDESASGIQCIVITIVIIFLCTHTNFIEWLTEGGAFKVAKEMVLKW